MSLVNALEVGVLEWYFFIGAASEAQIDTGTPFYHYFGLSTTLPNEAGDTSSEPSGGNYNRVFTSAGAKWASASGGSITTSDEVVFNSPSASWGTVTHFLIDQTSATTHRVWGTLTGAVAIGAGDITKFKTGDITITLTGLWVTAQANIVLDRIFNATGTPPGGNDYIGLSTTTPTAAGTNFTEPVGGSYARTGATTFNGYSGDPSYIVNDTAPMSFPEATAGWGTVTHWGWFENATGGSVLAWGALDSSEAVASGETLKFGVSDLTMTLD